MTNLPKVKLTVKTTVSILTAWKKSEFQVSLPAGAEVLVYPNSPVSTISGLGQCKAGLFEGSPVRIPVSVLGK